VQFTPEQDRLVQDDHAQPATVSAFRWVQRFTPLLLESTSRPRLRSNGMAPDGAALVPGALNQPDVSGQVGAQPSPDPRIDAFTQADGAGRAGPTVAYPMGRPMVSAGGEVSASLLAGCATADDVEWRCRLSSGAAG
jgi:hypothetical protein